MKKLLFLILRLSGLPFIMRELVQRNKVTILLYHDISKETAEKSFSFLQQHYNLISLNELISAYEQNDFNSLPKKALVITFDDGHVGNFDFLPVLKDLNAPVTIFLCAGIINTNRHFWWMTDTFKKLTRAALVDLPNLDRRSLMEKNGFHQEKEFSNRQALSKEEIREMEPHVNFQGHTMFHPFLPKCAEQEARVELIDSKQLLESEYGFEINAISYPIGVYSDRDIRLSKEAGYRSGITVDFGFNTIDTDRFRLKRISTNDTADLNELAVRASGLWSFIKTRNGKKQDIGRTQSIDDQL